MDGGLLALTWNNHRKTFFQILSTVRKKNTYADVTLACDGKFYQAHKLVLSTCSDYFKQMFEQMESNHIMIVLKDIKSGELELLLDYMYNGEVNVVQDEISGLIKAAECLQIKGLAVSDQDQSVSKQMSRDKRTSDTSSSSGAKRQRLEEESYISAAPDLRTSNKNGNKSAETKKTKNRDQHKSNLNNSSSTSNNTRHNRHMESLSTKDIQVMNVKTEDHDNSHEPNSNADVITQEAITTVKQEEIEWDTDDVPLSDCNSVTEADKSLRDEFGGKGYHQQFTDGLFVQDFPTTKQKIGDNMDTGHNARSSSSRDQQREVGSGHRVGSSISESNGEQYSCSSYQYSHTDTSVDHTGTREEYDFDEITKKTPVGSSGASSNDGILLPDNIINTFQQAVPFETLNLPELYFPTKGRYVCPLCPKELQHKEDFRRHYRVHTGEKPFRCQLCPYQSCQKGNLTRHLMKHINIAYP